MSKEKENVNDVAERELVITRVFNAPRELVWKVWTDAKHLAQWWGPKGFTNPVCRIDVRTGGEIYIEMKAPDDVVYPMSGVYKEIIKPERLVFISAALDKKGKLLFEVHNTIVFTDEKGKTKLTMTAIVSKITSEAEPYLAGMNEGWNMSLDRLAEYLTKNTDGQDKAGVDVSNHEMSITRLINAPRELVWKVWTEPEHIKNWWGPNGFTNTISKMDVRPGGEWEFVMHGPDGTDYQSKHVFKELVKPERIVLEHVTSPKFEITVTFEAQGNKTLMTWRSLFESAEQLQKAIKAVKADEGMKQNVDKLEAYLANL